MLIRTLRIQGFLVYFAHANKIRAFAKVKVLLAKTDKIDAFLISDYGYAIVSKADNHLLSLSLKDWMICSNAVSSY